MEHAKHVIRAVLLLALSTVAFILVRHFAIPQTFGMYGHYRFDSVAEHAGSTPVYGDVQTCAECHGEETEIKAEGKHASVSCEVCHGPLGMHVQGDQKVAAMPVPQSPTFCGRCHQRLVARPKDFPQLVFRNHVVEKGQTMNADVCKECHDAHNPSD